MSPPRVLAALAVGLALAGVPSARGQQAGAKTAPTGPAPLTLAGAVSRALDAAPQVTAARAAEAAARAQLAEAEADLLPVLALSGSAFRHQKPTIVTPIHGFAPGLFPSFDRSVLQGDLQVRYDLWDGGVRSARIAQRRAQLEAAEAATSAVAATAAARAVAAFLAVRSLDEQLAAHEQRRAALLAERSRVEQLLAVGRAAQVDLLRVQAAQASAEADRVGLAGQRDRASRDLLRLLGVAMEAGGAAAAQAAGAPAPPEPTLPPLAAAVLVEQQPPPRATLLARALAGSGEVRRARRELAAADAGLLAARRAGRALGLRLEGNLLGFAGGNGDAEGEWNAGVRVAVPLWDRHFAARLALAEAGRDGAAAALRLAEDAVGSDLDRAWADLSATLARAESLAEAEARYAEVVRVERLRLSAGAGVEADYLRAEADLLLARAAAIEARNKVAATRAELARVAGELSAPWVESAYAPPAAPEGERER
jgi:outer membrane protein TolC